jgi:hypothetical protein
LATSAAPARRRAAPRSLCRSLKENRFTAHLRNPRGAGLRASLRSPPSASR